MKKALRQISLEIFFGLLFTSGLWAGEIAKGPYLNWPTAHSIVVKWISASPEKGAVEYGLTQNLGKIKVDSLVHTEHVVKLTDLTPNTCYFYRVKTAKDSTPVYSFWTAPMDDSPFTFVVYGDSRSNHQAQQEILRLVVEQSPRFALHTGDLVQNGKKQPLWDKYFNDLCVYTRAGELIPIFYTIGNHERHSPLYFSYFELPQNNPLHTEEFYSFDYGMVHVIALSSEMRFISGTAQYRWLEADLKTAVAKSRWIFVFFHRPPYSSGEHGSSKKIRKAWHPLFKQYGVTAVFNGHDHIYERTKPIDGVTYFVAGGGGAPLYKFKPHKWTAHVESVYHLLRVDVSRDRVRVKMIRWDGTVGDSLTVAKEQ